MISTSGLDMAKVLTIANNKGGVGKTTLAVNLAAGLAVYERAKNPDRPGKVLIIDLDPSAAALLSINFDQYEVKAERSIYALFVKTPPPAPQTLIRKSKFHDNLFFIPTNRRAMQSLNDGEIYMLSNREGRLKRAIKVLLLEYQWIIIDTPPVMGTMLDNALIASSHVLVPVEPSYLGAKGLIDLESCFQKLRESFDDFSLSIIGYVPSIVDKRKSEHRDTIASLSERYPGRVLTPFHISVDYSNAHAAHMDVFTYAPPSHTSVQAAEQVVNQTIDLIDGR
ncbi:MAG: ParA family protein [Bacteroidales bacterium]